MPKQLQVIDQGVIFRLIDACLIAHQHAYEFAPGALALGQRICAGLDAARLRTFIDPDGQQLLPEDRYLADPISSEIAVISIAYWRARLNGISLE